MDSTRSASRIGLERGSAGAVTRSLRALARLFRLWRVRIRSRQLLADLNEHMLRDIGLTRAEVEREARKWFWAP